MRPICKENEKMNHQLVTIKGNKLWRWILITRAHPWKRAMTNNFKENEKMNHQLVTIKGNKLWRWILITIFFNKPIHISLVKTLSFSNMSVGRKTHSKAANAVIIILVLLIILRTKDTLGAARPLGRDMKTTVGANNVSFPADRGPVPPSGPNPCHLHAKPPMMIYTWPVARPRLGFSQQPSCVPCKCKVAQVSPEKGHDLQDSLNNPVAVHVFFCMQPQTYTWRTTVLSRG
jgi:hypothetical protein